MGFTPEQEIAINTRGNNILVSAAAGSGKTAVLVERIIRMVTDELNQVDIDKILVVTFTEAAAGEMRQRISNAISEKLDSDPDNQHLLKQAALLPVASISTIHSFCLKVIRNNFHKIDIDPAFKIADEIEMSLLKDEILDELLEDEYAKEDNFEFTNLVECLSGGRVRDEALKALILRVYSLIVNSPCPEECLINYQNLFTCEDINNTLWAEIIVNSVKTELEGILDNIKTAIRLCGDSEGPQKYRQALLDDVNLIKAIDKAADIGFTELHSMFQKIEHTKLPTYRKTELVTDRMAELKETVSAVRNREVKDRLRKMKAEMFFKPVESMAADIRAMKKPIEELCRLTLEYRIRFQAAKLERNVVDFNDLEHMCIDILYDFDSGERTKEAQELSEKYEEVFTDEYQDSNIVQEYILTAISKNNPPNRFMVGDIKQSIYRFRRASPELFAEKYDSYKVLGRESSHSTSHNNIGNGDENREGIRINLSKNFRSRVNILNAVNYFFSQMMIPELGGITYDEDAALYAGAVFPDYEELSSEETVKTQTVEIDIIDIDGSYTNGGQFTKTNDNATVDKPNDSENEDDFDELSKAEIEFGFIADRIKEITNPANGMKVFDKSLNGYRNAEYKDIVILTRSLANIEDAVNGEMKKRGIPVYIEVSDGFFKNTEVATVLSYLSIIDNPRQDIPLITVLHSPVYRVSVDELVELRGNDVKCDFYTCLKRYYDIRHGGNGELDKKLDKFFTELEKFRKISWHMSVGELVCEVYQTTGYYNYVGAMPGGSVRCANLLALKEFAERYEKGSLRGLFNFIRYMDKVKRSEGNAGEAKIVSDGANLVRVMTIHKSKGLEFPIVFLSLLGKQFNKEDERVSIVLHQKLGFGPMYFNSEFRYQSNTLARTALLKQIRNESLAEELRVLYVAMTRAKEKLIMTGAVKNLSSKLKSWSITHKGTKLPAYYILSSTGFLDWIGAALTGHRRFSKYIDNTDYSCGSIINSDFDADFDINIVNGMEVMTDYQINEKQDRPVFEASIGEIIEIDKKMTWRYPFESEKALPSVLSITEIYKIKKEQEDENAVNFLEPLSFEMPEFLRKDKMITGLRRGTVVHTVMKSINFDTVYDEYEIGKLLERLVNSGQIEHGEEEAVPISNIIEFTRSGLAKRIAMSSSVKRETPFVMGLKPHDIYGGDDLDSSDTILVRGIIDCFFEEDGQTVIVDYKTDNSSNGGYEFMDKYKTQLSVYKQAVEKSTGMKVKQCLLYFIGDNYMVETPTI